MKLSACIELVFAREAPSIPDRIRLAAAAGLAAVEFWSWQKKDLAEIEDVLDETGVELTTFLTEPRGRLTDPSTHEEFVEGVARSTEVAQRLGATGLFVQAGDTLPDVPKEKQRDAVIQALRAAAPIAERASVTLLLEPLNSVRDHVGFFLDRTADGLEIVEAVGSPRVRLLYDLYHSVMMAEEPEEVLAAGLGAVSYVHVADAPGRHEPGTGTIDWPRRIGWLRRQGYTGYVGLEYQPLAPSAETVERVQELFREAADAATAPSGRLP
jgi:hydroxypyruvate isomerase